MSYDGLPPNLQCLRSTYVFSL